MAEHNSVLLVDYADLEAAQAERVMVENKDLMAIIPYWAVWPFETLLLPRRHALRLPDLDDVQRDALAGILKRLLVKYDNLVETRFPYSLVWHGAPFHASTDLEADDLRRYWQLHAHFYPPLLRSTTVKKFMVVRCLPRPSETAGCNGGLALPMAVDRAIRKAVEPRDSDEVGVHSLGFGDPIGISLGVLQNA